MHSDKMKLVCFFLLSMVWTGTGCGGDPDAEADTDADVAAPDSGSDADLDADSDSDADADADADEDLEADADLDEDADGDADFRGNGDADLDADPDAEVDGDEDGPPGGFVEVLLSSPLVHVSDEPATVTARCRFRTEGALPVPEPEMTIATEPPLPAVPDGDGYVITISEAGSYVVSCAASDGSTSGSAMLLAVSPATPVTWSRLGDAVGWLTNGVDLVLAGHDADDRSLAEAGLEDLDRASARMTEVALARVPVFWGFPGGMPSEAELIAVGFESAPDDAAVSDALSEAATALDDLRTAYETASATDPTSLPRIDEATTRVQLAHNALTALDPSDLAALANLGTVDELVAEHAVPALMALTERVRGQVEADLPGFPPPPRPIGLLTFTLGLTVGASLRAQLITAVYGWAIDWIEGAVWALARTSAIADRFPLSADGPDVYSINASYAVHDGDLITIWGDRFAPVAHHNAVIFVTSSDVSFAVGSLTDCLSVLALPSSTDLVTLAVQTWNWFNSVRGCVDSLVGEAPDDEPVVGTHGSGEVFVEFMNPYGPMHYSVGQLPVHHPGAGLPIPVGVIPLNLSSGVVRGEPRSTLLYP